MQGGVFVCNVLICKRTQATTLLPSVACPPAALNPCPTRVSWRKNGQAVQNKKKIKLLNPLPVRTDLPPPPVETRGWRSNAGCSTKWVRNRATDYAESSITVGVLSTGLSVCKQPPPQSQDELLFAGPGYDWILLPAAAAAAPDPCP